MRGCRAIDFTSCALGGLVDSGMARVARSLSLPCMLALAGCGPGATSDAGSDDLGTTESNATVPESSESESESTTGEGGGPESDPMAPLDCWQPLGALPAIDVWGVSTQQLLLTTTEGVLRVEGDAMTTVGSGIMTAIWATDLDNGWVGHPTGLLRLVDGQLEAWPDVEFFVDEIAGLGPDDVWAGGSDMSGVLMRFDGSTWTTVDAQATFGDWSGSLRYEQMVATSSGIYFGSGYGVTDGLLVWDGQQGSHTPPYLDGWEHVSRLSTLDGVHPLAWMQWCDFGCLSNAYAIVGNRWQWSSQPHFDDWEPNELEVHDYHGEASGGVWSLIRKSFSAGGDQLRVARLHEGSWQRARVPDCDRIDALPDGAVILGAQPYRATSACLFGE